VRCPKATTVALKQNYAFARQIVVDDSQDRRAWFVLAESWLLLANIHEIVENRSTIEANKGKPASAQANTAQYRGAA
jgi:hypothetical protein